MPTYTPDAKERMALTFAEGAYRSMKDQLAFVTERVAFDMVNIVKKARKNYFGIFDVPTDTVTGIEKYWAPLTELIVETGVKTIDIDTKNFVIYNRNEVLPGFARIQQYLFWDKLKRVRWGPVLNDVERRTLIDGTAVLKACKEYDPKRKKWVAVPVPVDRLNFLTDMTADWLWQSPVKMERAIYTPDDFARYKNIWENTQYATVSRDVSRIDDMQLYGQTRQETPYVVVWDIWGKLPMSILTGNDQDRDEVFDGHAVISGMDQGKSVSPVVHLIEKNPRPDGLAPYQEIRSRKVPSRWDGRGTAEQLFGAQEYLNMTVNVRKNNAQILQNGLFKAKIGRGITSELVAQAVAGGVIPVYDMDDLQSLPVQDVRQSSYLDEDRIVNWAQRQTFASDAIQGAGLPASTTATTATIQDRNSKNAFDLIDEEMGMAFSEFFENFILPEMSKEYSADEVVRITGDVTDFSELDKAYVDHVVNGQVLEYVKKNVSVPSSEVIQREKKKALDKLKRLGRSRWLKVTKELQEQEYGLEVVVVNERIDRTLIVQQLKELLAQTNANPNSKFDPDKVVEEMLYLMGLDAGRMAKDRTPDETALVEQFYGKPSGAAAPQMNPESVRSRLAPGSRMNPGQVSGNAAALMAQLPSGL